MSEPLKAPIPPDAPKTAFNFRQVIPTADTSDVTESPAVLYRSSRLDTLSEEEVTWFNKNGIRTIIDGRSLREYNKADGEKNIEKHYPVQKVSFPFLGWRYHVGDKVKATEVTTNQNEERHGNHFLVNFLRLGFYAAFLGRVPWYLAIYSLWFLVKDIWNKNVHWTNFFLFFERRCPIRLIGHYKNFVNGSQASIAASLKLLSQPGALPAIIVCQFGKDRTGLLVAFILTLMGKSREYVVWEYALSQEGMASQVDRMRVEVCERYHVNEDLLTARKETIIEILDYVEERYGGVEAYLEHCGFGKEEQETLRRNIAGKLKQS
ncbi:uncharacterized protein LOC135495140 [Lineus longissimus]|uniref:uncharacterized protein LOC135495140 n=1 Tax=Lineus longissimus TaxID=88925 RepID=UPI002B4C6765